MCCRLPTTCAIGVGLFTAQGNSKRPLKHCLSSLLSLSLANQPELRSNSVCLCFAGSKRERLPVWWWRVGFCSLMSDGSRRRGRAGVWQLCLLDWLEGGTLSRFWPNVALQNFTALSPGTRAVERQHIWITGSVTLGDKEMLRSPRSGCLQKLS